MNDHDIELNTRNVKARTVAFLVALALAVAAFAVGITSLSRKSPGYYDVEANTDDETILYAKTVRLRYYFADGKADIRSTLRELQTVYPGALKEFSRMLDAETTFPGVINPAMLNSNPGKEMTVSAELLAVLTDAYEKTCEQQGYNMFAGPLYAVWDTLLYLEEPQSFDPAVNASEQERIRRIAAVVNDLDNFRFEVVDAVKHIVRFDYSDTVRRMLEEEELGDRILDLNLLREAYLLRLIGDRLEQRGFSDGYLSTTDGQVLCLSGELPGDYCLYGFEDSGAAVPAATAPLRGGSAFSHFRTLPFPDETYGYYVVESEQDTLRRHPFVPASGEYPNVLESSCVLEDRGDLVAACYANLRLNACPDLNAASALAAKLSQAAAFTLQTGNSRTVCANARAQAALNPVEEGGWSLSPLP